MVITSSVWRPLHNPAEDYPLAILDPTTLDPDEDLIIVDRLSYGANMPSDNIAYNPNHRWYWLSKQRPEEVVVFVQYDTHPPEDLLNRKSASPSDLIFRSKVLYIGSTNLQRAQTLATVHSETQTHHPTVFRVKAWKLVVLF